MFMKAPLLELMLKKDTAVAAGCRGVGVKGRVKFDTNMQEDVGVCWRVNTKKQIRAKKATTVTALRKRDAVGY